MTEIHRGKVVTVARSSGKPRAGQGLLKGMAVIWQHFQGSFRKNESFQEIHGTFTVQYPDERVKLPEPFRNMPILLYDEATGHELCTSCFQCQRICPPQVIHMTQAKDPDTGKAVPAVAEFIIEYDACMSCGFCAEVCPFDAIKMDHDFELSTDVHGGLTVNKAQLNRPISYYAGIAPTTWSEAEAGAMKKLQGNIKRRPDVIGMAPNLVEKIAARRRELAEAKAQEPEVSSQESAAAAPPPAEPRKLTPEEKAAKLAAIRAAKAQGAAPAAEGASAPAPQPAPPPDPEGSGPESAPSDDKAARLAAIRARNAAKAQTQPTPPPAAEGASASAPQPTPPPAAEGASASAPQPAPAADPSGSEAAPPTDDKAARLAAIRAKNAAKKAAEAGDDKEQ